MAILEFLFFKFLFFCFTLMKSSQSFLGSKDGSKFCWLTWFPAHLVLGQHLSMHRTVPEVCITLTKTRKSLKKAVWELEQHFKLHTTYSTYQSIGNWVLYSGMLLYLQHGNSKLFFYPAKVDSFKDEIISDYKTVSLAQSKNLLDWKLLVYLVWL